MDAPSKKTPLTPKEVAVAFADPFWAQRFPPILSVEQAGELISIPTATIYDWASRGRLENCSFRAGKYRRVWRDRFILQFFNQ
jgi:hypothetical protein